MPAKLAEAEPMHRSDKEMVLPRLSNQHQPKTSDVERMLELAVPNLDRKSFETHNRTRTYIQVLEGLHLAKYCSQFTFQSSVFQIRLTKS